MKRIAIFAAAAVLAGCTSTTIVRDKDTANSTNKDTVTVIVEAPSIYGYAKVWRKAEKVTSEACGAQSSPPPATANAAFQPMNVMDLLDTGKEAIDELTALRKSVKGFFGKTTVTLKVKCP